MVEIPDISEIHKSSHFQTMWSILKGRWNIVNLLTIFIFPNFRSQFHLDFWRDNAVVVCAPKFFTCHVTVWTVTREIEKLSLNRKHTIGIFGRHIFQDCGQIAHHRPAPAEIGSRHGVVWKHCLCLTFLTSEQASSICWKIIGRILYKIVPKSIKIQI